MPKDARPGLKAKIKTGTPLIGSYVTFPSPEVVELFARAGMDYVIIDLQHASPDWQTLAHMLRAADAGGADRIVAVMPPPHGLGHAVRDRLTKAAAARTPDSQESEGR